MPLSTDFIRGYQYVAPLGLNAVYNKLTFLAALHEHALQGLSGVSVSGTSRTSERSHPA